jgi:hypothetical protein
MKKIFRAKFFLVLLFAFVIVNQFASAAKFTNEEFDGFDGDDNNDDDADAEEYPDEDFEVGSSGNVKVSQARPPQIALSVTFENQYDEDLELFWVNPDNQDQVPMGDIPSHGTIGVNTFPQHTFTASLKDSGASVSPATVRNFMLQHCLLFYL